ncbi:MAG: insulinase family protein [Bacilli bacterium]|nr:insulinase family protein [Bacilli bacterium]
MKKIPLKGLNEIVYYDECENGLPILLWPHEKAQGYYLTLSVKYGSLHTEFRKGNKNYQVPNGVAHFLEHLNFQEEDGDAQTFYQKNGSDVNAFTTFLYTSYEVYGSDFLKENLEHLLDFVMTPYFDQKMVQNEKNIIVEENKMDLDNPANMLYYGMYRNLFKKDKHQYYITGEKKDILKTTLEDIQLVYDTFYHPANMFLIVTGQFNPYEVVHIVKENQKMKDFPTWTNPKFKEIKEPAKIVKEYEEIFTNVEIPKIRLGIKIPRKQFKESDNVKLRFLLTLILNSNFGSTSDLYEELMEQDLIVGLSTEKTIVGDYVVIFVNAETKYPDEVIPLLKQAFQHLKMDEKTLNRKLHSAIANMVLGYDDIVEVNSGLQEQIIYYGKVLEDQKELLNSLTLEDVHNVISSIRVKEMSTMVLKPNKN